MQMNAQVSVNGEGGGGDFVKRGIKRDASDSNLSDFERFEKRLRMLSLRGSERNGNARSNIYTPISTAPSLVTANGTPHVNHVNSQDQDEHMQVDDTRDKVFIHDLDAELENIESDEDKLIFLPDIEKRLSKIPKQVLGGSQDDDHDNQELVLYSLPKSLTVDEGHDSVRKAIVEARQRAREKAVEDARQEDINRKYDHSGHVESTETAHGYSSGYAENTDPDAMDIGNAPSHFNSILRLPTIPKAATTYPAPWAQPASPPVYGTAPTYPVHVQHDGTVILGQQQMTNLLIPLPATDHLTTPKALIPNHLMALDAAIDFSEKAVVIKVGTPFNVFHANAKLLCTSSEYFAAALNGRWSESKSKVIELPNDDKIAFNIYLNWLHSHKIYADYEDDDGPGASCVPALLIQCYFLGDKLLDGDFKDAIIDALMLARNNSVRNGTTFFPRTSELYWLYENTVQDATVRKFMAFLFASEKKPNLVTEREPPAFLLDYSNALMVGAEDVAGNVAACVFHEHAPGPENCYRNQVA